MLWVLYRHTYFMGGFHRYLIGIRSVSDRYFIGIVSVWVVSLPFIGMSLVFNRYSIGVNHARVSCGACQGRQTMTLQTGSTPLPLFSFRRRIGLCTFATLGLA